MKLFFYLFIFIFLKNISKLFGLLKNKSLNFLSKARKEDWTNTDMILPKLNQTQNNIHNSSRNKNIEIIKKDQDFSFEQDPVYMIAYKKFVERQQEKEKIFNKTVFNNKKDKIKNINNILQELDNIKKILYKNKENNNTVNNGKKRFNNLRNNYLHDDNQGEFEDTNIFSVPYKISEIQKPNEFDKMDSNLDQKILEKFKKIYNLLNQNTHSIVNPKINENEKKKINCNLNKIDFTILRTKQIIPICDFDEIYDPILSLCINVDCLPIQNISI